MTIKNRNTRTKKRSNTSLDIFKKKNRLRKYSQKRYKNSKKINKKHKPKNKKSGPKKRITRRRLSNGIDKELTQHLGSFRPTKRRANRAQRKSLHVNYLPQHFLYFNGVPSGLVLPHGHGSFLPTLSSVLRTVPTTFSDP